MCSSVFTQADPGSTTIPEMEQNKQLNISNWSQELKKKKETKQRQRQTTPDLTNNLFRHTQGQRTSPGHLVRTARLTLTRFPLESGAS